MHEKRKHPSWIRGLVKLKQNDFDTKNAGKMDFKQRNTSN